MRLDEDSPTSVHSHDQGSTGTAERSKSTELPEPPAPLESLGSPGRTTSAAFQAQYVARDIQAGIITGAMAIPLSVGIALMSDYPITVALATVAFACFIGWINAFGRPGNYIGAPGVAAGLAPVLAMGVASFGMENMAFVIFLTATMQAL